MNPSNFQFLTLEGAAAFYDATMRLSEIYKREMEIDTFQIKLEDIIRDLDLWTTRVCEFLGLTWHRKMREFSTNASRRELATPSASQIRTGLTAAGIGHWRAYREFLTPILPTLEKWVTKFGYERD